MARFCISVGIGFDEIETDDQAYCNYVVAHYRKQGLTPLVIDGEEDFDADDYETTFDAVLRHTYEAEGRSLPL